MIALLQGKPNGYRLFENIPYVDNRGQLSAVSDHELEAAVAGEKFIHTITSWSKRGVIRGLHYQFAPAMGKFVRCLNGRVQAVILELRPGTSQGKHLSVVLDNVSHKMLWVPFGYAFGFKALEDSTVQYRCTAEWSGSGEGGIQPFDPHLHIEWMEPQISLISQRDKNQQSLNEFLASEIYERYFE